MKRIYEKPELNIVILNSEDIINISGLQSNGSKFVKNTTGINKWELNLHS